MEHGKKKKKTYNGWTNYETWAVKLWLDNSEGDQDYWLDRANEINDMYELSEELKTTLEENNPLNEGEPSVFTDLLNAALSEVNFYEIAETLIREAKEIKEAEEKEV